VKLNSTFTPFSQPIPVHPTTPLLDAPLLPPLLEPFPELPLDVPGGFVGSVEPPQARVSTAKLESEETRRSAFIRRA
jgi:hypothetical protein